MRHRSAVITLGLVLLSAAWMPAPSVHDDAAADETPLAEIDDIRVVYERFTTADHWRKAKAAGERLLEFGEDAVDLLRAGAEDSEDETVRRRCYDLLVANFATHPRSVRTIMHHGLEDENVAIRYMCAFHLGEHEVFESFRKLEHLVGDAEQPELVRFGAAKSLAELGEATGLPLVYDGMGSDDYMPRYLSNLALKALTGKDMNDFDYDYAEGAFVSGGVEAKHPRRPVEDARTRARRYEAVARFCEWLRDSKPELYKHIDGTW